MTHNDTSPVNREPSRHSIRKRRRVMFTLGVCWAVGAAIGAGLSGCQPENGAQAQSGTANPTSETDPREAFRAFAQCMRDHSIANYPDPTKDGINLQDTGIDPNTPEFKAAREACQSLLPRGGSPAGGPHASGERAQGSERFTVTKTAPTQWDRIVPGGGCECADGSEWAFFEHRADASRVVLYLDGGGACFDAASCANANTPGTGERPGPDYDPNIDGENPASEGGILDFVRAENPFREFSALYVPQCTADTHLGNTTHQYTSDITVRHKGLVNGTAALSHLAEHYPGATHVVVVGHTTIAAPLYGGLVADRLPNAQITVFAAQAGTVPDDPNLNANIGDVWGVYDSMPGWNVNEGVTAQQWGGRQFWISASRHKPEMVMARFDYAFDPNAAETLAYLAVEGIDPANTLAVIDANEAAIEAAGVTVHSYTAPGRHHGILEYDKFYEMEVNGVRLADWLKALVERKPLGDIRCSPCED